MPDLPQHQSITRCPKCAAPEEKLGVAYHAANVPASISVILTGGERDIQPCAYGATLGEHLCRRCQRCGYGWCEAVVEAGPAPEGEQ